MNGVSSVDRTQATAAALSDAGNEAAPAEERQDLLPAIRTLTCSGDLGAMITAMMLEAGRDARKVARASQDAAAEAEDAAQKRELEAMEEAASNQLYGGLASGSATVAGGAVSIAGAARTAQVASKAADTATKAGATAEAAARAGDRASTTAATSFSASAKAAEGHGVISKSIFDLHAADANREAKGAESGARQAGRQIESARDDQREAGDMIRRALDAYKQYLDTKDAAARATFLKA